MASIFPRCVRPFGLLATRSPAFFSLSQPVLSLQKSFPPPTYTASLLAAADQAVKARALIKETATSLNERYSKNEFVFLGMRAKYAGKAAPKDAAQRLKDGKYASLEEMMQLYESLMAPALGMKEKEASCQEKINDLKYKMASKDKTADQQKQMQKTIDDLAVEKGKIAEDHVKYANANFSTQVYNNILNHFRVAIELGQSSGVVDAYQVALRVSQDMNQNGIVHDEVTNFLLRNIIFGDTVEDDSYLFFNLIENPEKGEIVFEKNNTEEVEDRMWSAVERRHNFNMKVGRQVLRDENCFIRHMPADLPPTEKSAQVENS